MINKLGWITIIKITNTKNGQRSNPSLKSKNLNEEGCLQWRCTLWKPLSGRPLENTLNKSEIFERLIGIRFRSSSSTTLSSYIWDLKDLDLNYDISWCVIDRGKPSNPVTRRCNLCIKEKFHIIFQPEGASLNKRSELFSTCRHRK